jgi:hypothetical protein
MFSNFDAGTDTQENGTLHRPGYGPVVDVIDLYLGWCGGDGVICTALPGR